MKEVYKKILIATDGSDKNRDAVKEGLKIAAACNSMVYLVYVIDTGTISAVPTDVSGGSMYQVLEEEGRRAMENAGNLAGGMKSECLLLAGKPAPEIIRFAGENGVDLIVIGTKGKTGIERLLLGSVAENIIRGAHCPVLVVKAAPEAAPAGKTGKSG
jgi:nucleotide-binding universal stress UspA family protein